MNIKDDFILKDINIEDIKEFMELRKGKCRYLDYKKIKEFINEISNKKIIDYKLMLVK